VEVRGRGRSGRPPARACIRTAGRSPRRTDRASPRRNPPAWPL